MSNKQIYDFDQFPPRRGSHSVKWERYGESVLPLWVADMDFAVAPAITEALEERIAHPIFGYSGTDPQLLESICIWLQRRYAWQVGVEQIMLIPGVVTGVNLAANAFASASGGMLIQTPVYPPFFQVARHASVPLLEAPLVQNGTRYEIDFDVFENKISQGASLFVLCNPHNPVGRVFTRSELQRMGEICLRHNVIVCSDEIHCDLVYPEYQHIPIASMNEEFSANTVTLMAPSKTFNMPGLDFSFAILPNEKMRRDLVAAGAGMVGRPNLLADAAAKAAFMDGQDWLAQLMLYLQGNRDYLFGELEDRLPLIKSEKPEGTYLAWLDCRALNLEPDPFTFFLENAGVALSDGATFGEGGKGFVRLNFGCPRSLLSEALERMVSAVEKNGQR